MLYQYDIVEEIVFIAHMGLPKDGDCVLRTPPSPPAKKIEGGVLFFVIYRKRRLMKKLLRNRGLVEREGVFLERGGF